jgi:anaerobic magnesium-protoporphyrin IX monomethyl ester cyclase
MARILLISPSFIPSYGGTKSAVSNPFFPALGIAAVAATARERGHEVQILDLSYLDYNHLLVRERIVNFAPDIVGITATTPLFNQARDISILTKDIAAEFNNKIWVVAGGPHVTALPEESLRESMLDVVFVGEADFSFADFCDALDPLGISGLWYRDGETIINNGWRPLIENLDDLPMPAWDLYDPENYKGKVSRLLAKRTPLLVAEFSRGCVFECDFCASKLTLGQGYRKKSPERCAAEVARIKEVGFKEFWLADDIFTSDQKWATSVCNAITAKNLDIAWTCTNGIRVESADNEVFNALKRAGCYRVGFGFESGNDDILKSFGKGGKASVEQGEKAVALARKAGLDTSGTFLLGLAQDTETTMMDTIHYASQLPLDMMKFGVTIAFPGTVMFDQYAKKHWVRTFDWDKYCVFTDEALFTHEHLSYDTIKKYMSLAYQRAMFFNLRFILRRIYRGIHTGDFFWDFYYAMKIYLLPASSASDKSAYYARDRWPTVDYTQKTFAYPGLLKPGGKNGADARLKNATAIPFKKIS